MMQFTKKYQVWEMADGNQFTFTEFDTLDECVSAQKYGSWYITKKVSLSVKDADDQTIVIPGGTMTGLPVIFADSNNAIVHVDEEKTDASTAYETGKIGKIT